MSNVGQTIPFTLRIAKSKLYMAQLRLTILFLFIAIISYAQEDVIEFEKITFKGLRLISTKAKIIESFGEPRIVGTNYECEAFANDLPGGPYYLLSYNGFNYIGSDKDTFTLHSIVFDQEGILKLYLDGWELSGMSTEDDFIKLFGGKVKDRFVKHSDITLCYFTQKTVTMEQYSHLRAANYISLNIGRHVNDPHMRKG